MKIIAIIFFVMFSSVAFGNGKVVELKSSKELEVVLNSHDDFKVGKKVLIISQFNQSVIAFGKITMINNNVEPWPAIIIVEEVIHNSIININDMIEPLDYKLIEKKKVPGVISLTLEGRKHTPAKFNELATFGVFTAEGHTLDKNEVLISPFQIQYGVNDKLGLKLANSLLLDDYLNAGLKVSLLRNQFVKISANTLGAAKIQGRDWIWTMGGVITLPQNSKFQNHLVANIVVDPQYSGAHATKSLNLYQNSDIRNITEYVTDSWNRILYGVVYDVELHTIGGTFSYMWIWDVFHMSLGIGSRDVTELKVSENGYYYVYDFFWRF